MEPAHRRLHGQPTMASGVLPSHSAVHGTAFRGGSPIGCQRRTRHRPWGSHHSVFLLLGVEACDEQEWLRAVAAFVWQDGGIDLASRRRRWV